MGQYIAQSGIKRFQFDDGTICDVVAVLKLDSGQNVALIPAQLAKLDAILGELQTLNASSATDFEKIQAADDYAVTYTYLDEGDLANERIQTVTYTSISLSLSVTDTYTYAGSAGAYRLVGVQRA